VRRVRLGEILHSCVDEPVIDSHRVADVVGAEQPREHRIEEAFFRGRVKPDPVEALERILDERSPFLEREGRDPTCHQPHPLRVTDDLLVLRTKVAGRPPRQRSARLGVMPLLVAGFAAEEGHRSR
jgi:hypothetical protein